MSTRHIVTAALAAVILTSASLLAQKPQKAPRDIFYPATAAFSNRIGDAITSDGLGTYANGGGMDLGFHSVTNDLVIGGGPRYIQFNSTDQVTTTGPEGVIQDFDYFINIHGILNMAPGEFRQSTANMSDFRFNPTKWAGTTRVSVFRDFDGAWTITAEPSDVSALTQVVKGKEKAIGLYHMPFQLTVVCPSCS